MRRHAMRDEKTVEEIITEEEFGTTVLLASKLEFEEWVSVSVMFFDMVDL